MWGCVLLALGFSLESYLSYRSAVNGKQYADNSAVQVTGLTAVNPKHLASQFADVNGRLLADAPVNPGDLIDPSTIVVAHWQGTDADTPDIPWDQFEDHLSKVLGRPVKDFKYDNSPAQIDQIKAGQITLVALHAADAPFLVNTCGYQPVAVLAGDSGAVSGNHLDLIVPAKSPINSPSDLRGHVLTCVVPTSVTGYRAAIALLMDNEKLRPNVDYNITWSLKQKAAIDGIAKSQYEAAAVSDDKLQSMLQSGKIQPADYRIIYQSQTIPRLTIGWFYNLKPELAAKIHDAILSFHPDMSAVSAPTTQSSSDDDASASPPQAMHWVPTDYKADFTLVRLIDDSFEPRLNAKAAK